MKNSGYVHGYSERESIRLDDQAATLEELLHSDTKYPAGDSVLEAGCGIGAQTVILAKNSDRPPSEAQPLVYFPRQQHQKGETVKCTYIEIPQMPETYEHIGSRIWWTFGYEHGMNEHGVAIGNEAVWSKEPYKKEGGLLGMDLLRLALERGKTAEEAMRVIIDLLEKYGQGGDCERPGP